MKITETACVSDKLCHLKEEETNCDSLTLLGGAGLELCHLYGALIGCYESRCLVSRPTRAFGSNVCT